MNNINRFLQWLKDPFGRREIEAHDEIIHELEVTTRVVRQKTRFPIGSVVGNPDLRGETQHHAYARLF